MDQEKKNGKNYPGREAHAEALQWGWGGKHQEPRKEPVTAAGQRRIGVEEMAR